MGRDAQPARKVLRKHHPLLPEGVSAELAELHLHFSDPSEGPESVTGSKLSEQLPTTSPRDEKGLMPSR